ncbi:M3 family metallopeptidase [Legionella yabuuchiae]|uniref:M3 family metallopeptidase n=1 Tax=Legionella yabuuchiae TaxID=376727 RepID=UPI0010544A7E|nr:M3 family metallopeptidase [Legionella yabuuchiae]
MSIDALPQFSQIDVDHFSDALGRLLSDNLQKINALLQQNTSHTWESLMEPLEEIDDKLEQFWSPMAHLHAVVNSKERRACYQACLPKLSAYESAVGHNKALYEAIKSIDCASLNTTQTKIISDTVRDFELSGVALEDEEKAEFEKIQARLSELSNQFENNVLDATQAYELHIEDETRVSGLPEHALHAANVLAEEKGLKGWVFNLEIPCYLAIATYAEDRSLREALYTAFVTRASDAGPNRGEFDNTPVMDEILSLRHRKAQLLGFSNFAELSLATKMAESPEQVMSFLHDLNQQAHPQAQKEFAELRIFAQKELQLDALKPWDVAYASEKKQHAEHAISQEALRPYFPLPKVMEGMFSIIHKLYGMHVKEVNDVDTWHPDVTCYQVADANHQVRGYLYCDLFARPNKRGGAWMDSMQSRRKLKDGSIQRPIATLTCNFAKAVAGKPAALSHDEVLTLFHEMGHCLHHVLTQVDYISASGINGVEWDAVELPSQFFENWCWEEDSLLPLTAHIETQEPLPKELFNKLLAAKNFQSAMTMVRQLEFSLFDFRIHREYESQRAGFIPTILADVRTETAVVPIVSYNRFQHSFSHIFAGGYAAGYYSYKWAEVLSSDAFSRFEEEGIFNSETGRDFLHCILEAGGAQKAEQAFEAFRRRPARVDALLRHNGIK